jgi:hypothetical protein
MADVETPTTFGFTEQDAIDNTKDEHLPLEQWYRFRVEDNRFKVTTTGDNPGTYTFSLRCSALADPNDVQGDVFGPSAWLNVAVPKVNPDVPGHKKPKSYQTYLSACAMRALFPDELPDPPYREGGALIYNGDEIDNADEKACKAEAMRMVQDKLEEMLGDTSIAVDRAFYGFFVEKPDKRDPDRKYHNITEVCYELQPDKRTGEIPVCSTVADTEYSAKTAAPKGGNGATGRAKAAKGKGRKKASRRGRK